MNAVEVVQNNFNNWNRHDAEAIVAAFAEGGTYSNPTPFTGEAIGDFAKTVWTIFPDFSLDLISIGETGGSRRTPMGVPRHQHRRIPRRYSCHWSARNVSGSSLRSG